MYSLLLKTALSSFLIVSVALPQEDLAGLYSEARQAQATGDLATATRRYEAIVQRQPQMAEAYANLGNLYYQQGQANRAKEVYQKAVKLKPDLAGPHFVLGVIAFGEHDYSAALDYLKRAAALQSSNPLIHSYLGYTRYARSEFREAAGELEEAADLSPTDIDVLYHLGKSYGHLANDSFGKLQKQFPNSVYTVLVRAHLDETKEDWIAAGQQYTIAVQKMPADERLREKSRWIAAKAAGTAAPDKGPADEIVDASLAYKDSPPTGPRLREEMARWQSKIHGFPTQTKSDRDLYLSAEGFQILSYLSSLAVVELDPESYRAHQLRAQMLEELNNDEGAIGEYRDALRRKPDLPNIHFAIGSLYWKDQKFDAAWTELQQELRTNPNHAQALYELADIRAFQGHAEEAEKYYLKALKLEPAMVEAHFGLEKIYTESGLYEKSLYHLRAVLKADSSDSTAHYRLARVYRKMNRPQEAEKELAIFNQHRPQSSQNGSSTGK
ncbi:MAG: tetratricopeptide repeat protein [Acidobacteriota bacterium]|nr:tetratricopeptide repeat protein [Acidobacteriota bacterium]